MKLMTIDLDGTLLNSRHELGEENIKAIKAAQQQGIEIVIATGRAEFDVRQVFEGTGVRTWVIGANGATIHKPDGSRFADVPIQRKDAEDILAFLSKKQYYYEVFSDTAIYTPLNGRELLEVELDRVLSANPEEDRDRLKQAMERQFSQTGFSHVNSYEEILEADVPMYNILAFSFEKEKLEKDQEKFRHYPDLTLVTSAEHNFEFEHGDASKGIALEKLARELGISLGDTAAIGDSPNDLSMIETASHTAAMANAHPDVKNAADFLTKSNDEHGVAEFIYQWLD
ncbi:Cof-type HAD-IIB family hydrolase [Halobacillus salinarum]|uniref:Cof-type HAD-IIB family hydrolase n=1 Tax=Halobacillus salinarum TaxID=2932257 RepID=A0ABY4EPR6_9BACI|nr:Cof-type HAD-IIB family hydrolase [Halobacillus salinarum]UOQ46365.1 Cof-type HAD-IIB family hydrolase [Halobacillus salinarum]